MTAPTIFSQRLLRKGPLVEETYRLFAGWDLSVAMEDNLAQGLRGIFRSLGWEREVVTTISRRLKHFDLLMPLVVLAERGLPLLDWRDCWRLWIGATEQPFGRFALDWLYDEYQSGRYHLNSEDVRELAKDAWAAQNPQKPLSDYGVQRTARDLLKTAGDLGMLSGNGPIKTFAPITMSNDVFLFYVHQIAGFEGTYTKVPSSKYWRLAYMGPEDVHRTLLRLHQYRKLDYQIAGTFVQLTLPQKSALGFAESITS
ncbi:hypothetical protein [Mesorhizobium sp. M0586]|uniref:hypothetical protein n=1 Tax=unclassified Mesorhizobium TaxID=325217 RepID=UPI003337B1BA